MLDRLAEVKETDALYMKYDDKIDICPIMNTKIFMYLNKGKELEKLCKKFGQQYILNQLFTGMFIEFEHDPGIEGALNIAADHILEIPDYYSRLLAMEDEAGE